MAIPQRVLEAFSIPVSVSIQALPGGQGESALVNGTHVFKPSTNRIEAEWAGKLMSILSSSQSQQNFRVPVPLQTADGLFEFEGWTAAEYIPNTTPSPADRWADVLSATRHFNAAIANVPLPPFLHERSHPWATADRVAWEETGQDPPLSLRSPLQGIYDQLVSLRDSTGTAFARSQLVHGDMTGNVLFPAPASLDPRPVIIDFSPFWRPPTYAEAIVVADALVYHRMDGPFVRKCGLVRPESLQLLVRALIFRVVALSELARRGIMGDVSDMEIERFERVIGCVRECLHSIKSTD